MPSEGDAPRVVRASSADAAPVTDYDAAGVAATPLAHGEGPWTATVLHVDAGGSLGAHVAGRDQVLLVVSGEGWLEVEGARVALSCGDAGFVAAGQRHAKGSDAGMVALALQAPRIDGADAS